MVAALSFVIPGILHFLGLILLILTPKDHLGFSNKLYYLALSFAEFLICTLGMMKRLWISLNRILNYLQYAFGYVTLYLVIISLTCDRFLRVYLNIKYPLYWSNQKTIKMLSSFLVLDTVLFVIFFVTDSKLFLDTWMFQIFDFLFIAVAMITYTYIFYKIQRNRRQVSADSNKTARIAKGKEFFSIFFLVMTFFIFSVVPDLVYWYHIFNDVQLFGTWKEMVLTFSYSTSYTVDFFIYTFYSEPVRQRLRSLIRKLIF